MGDSRKATADWPEVGPGWPGQRTAKPPRGWPGNKEAEQTVDAIFRNKMKNQSDVFWLLSALRRFNPELAIDVNDLKDIPEGEWFLILRQDKVTPYTGYEATDGVGSQVTQWKITALKDEGIWLRVMKHHYTLQSQGKNLDDKIAAFKVVGQVKPKVSVEVSL